MDAGLPTKEAIAKKEEKGIKLRVRLCSGQDPRTEMPPEIFRDKGKTFVRQRNNIMEEGSGSAKVKLNVLKMKTLGNIRVGIRMSNFLVPA